MADEKETNRGLLGQRSKETNRGLGGATDSASIASDIFQRVTQLGGLLVVSVITPIGPGAVSAGAPTTTRRALLGIAEGTPPASPANPVVSQPAQQRGLAERKKMLEGRE
jgi:hypothetical protein